MKNNESLVRAIFLWISVVLVVGIVILIFTFRSGMMEEETIVGAVLIGVSDDGGWNESHYNGIKYACDSHECKFMATMNVPEEEEAIRKAVSSLTDRGCSVIFLTSYGYGSYADEIAKQYPDVAFYCISGDGSADNCASYFARMYQVRYLSGIVAGSASESGMLGYVTAMPIPETIRSIDAYTLGARKANPDAKVMVVYTGSWDDKEAEESAARKLAEAGADVMTFHEDRPYAIDLADEMGLYTTGYDFVSGEYSDKFLTAALIEWDILYETVLSDYLSGRANFSNDYWLGLSDGAVSIYPYSAYVSDEARDMVSAEEQRIRTWRDVFSGEIYDNSGTLRCRDNETIGDDELFNKIDWYVDGVEICE
ncbi:basic membrane protein A [Lachnospiraceae bacterium XBB2008]|nr:basic membrane protein A [Lachnospiraceae bacterium XBB2008]